MVLDKDIEYFFKKYNVAEDAEEIDAEEFEKYLDPKKYRIVKSIYSKEGNIQFFKFTVEKIVKN